MGIALRPRAPQGLPLPELHADGPQGADDRSPQRNRHRRDRRSVRRLPQRQGLHEAGDLRRHPRCRRQVVDSTPTRSRSPTTSSRRRRGSSNRPRRWSTSHNQSLKTGAGGKGSVGGRGDVADLPTGVGAGAGYWELCGGEASEEDAKGDHLWELGLVKAQPEVPAPAAEPRVCRRAAASPYFELRGLGR